MPSAQHSDGVAIVHHPFAGESVSPPAEGEAWSNGAGYHWEWHAHSVRKIVYCTRGTVTFHTQDGDVELAPGDRLDIPVGALHSATVGDAGVTCVEIRVPDGAVVE